MLARPVMVRSHGWSTELVLDVVEDRVLVVVLHVLELQQVVPMG